MKQQILPMKFARDIYCLYLCGGNNRIMLYFKFKEERTPKPETDKKQSFLGKVADASFGMIAKLIGDANPDLSEHHDKICTWYIEYDDVEYKLVVREIGVDANGNVLFFAPSKRNFGYWCDLDVDIEFYKQHFDLEEITKEEFESLWKSLNDN